MDWTTSNHKISFSSTVMTKIYCNSLLAIVDYAYCSIGVRTDFGFGKEHCTANVSGLEMCLRNK